MKKKDEQSGMVYVSAEEANKHLEECSKKTGLPYIKVYGGSFYGPVLKPTNIMTVEKLIKQIEAMMSENETIKANAMSATIATSSDAARRAYNNAKAENNAYQKVLDLIKEGE